MKKAYIILLFVVLMGMLNLASAQCWLEDKITGKKFKIFNALLYEDLSLMKDLCIEDINVLYAWEFFPRGHKKKPNIMPKKATLNKVVANIKKNKLLTVIDIEHWDLKDENIAKNSVTNYINVVKYLKNELPELNVGYYGVVPVVDFFRAKSNVKGAEYKSWLVDNNRVKPVADIIDATFPSLYTINSNTKSWILRAKAHIKESKRLAENKPVYPFIWPNYHGQGGLYPKGYEVEAEYWRIQLDYLRKNADGIVLWGGYKQKFKNSMSWWLETKKFINESFFIKYNE